VRVEVNAELFATLMTEIVITALKMRWQNIDTGKADGHNEGFGLNEHRARAINWGCLQERQDQRRAHSSGPGCECLLRKKGNSYPRNRSRVHQTFGRLDVLMIQVSISAMMPHGHRLQFPTMMMG
jgi:hypothetical protein